VRRGNKAVVFLLLCCFAARSFPADDVVVRSLSPETKTSPITITTQIPQTFVFLNGTYLGTTPLTVNNLTPGIYRLLLQKKGYKDREIMIEAEFGKEKKFYFDMTEITGQVKLAVSPVRSLVFIDGVQINKDIEKIDDPSGEYMLSLSEGEHKALVRLFGYGDQEFSFSAVEGITMSVSRTLVPAKFAVTDLRITPGRFNPDNPGKIGTCAVRFSVTARGNAEIVISGENGEAVRRLAVADFSTWEQSALWDGKDENGARVPDGTYTIALNAGASAPAGSALFAAVRVDSFHFDAAEITALGSGASAMPFPFTLAKDVHAASFITAPLWISGGNPPDVPFVFRFSSSPLENVEYTISGGLHFLRGSNTPVTLGASIKYTRETAAGKTGRFNYGVLARYGYSSSAQEFDVYSCGLGAALLAGFAHNAGGATLRYDAASSAVYGGDCGILSAESPVWWKNALSATIQYAAFSGTLWTELLSAFRQPDAQNWLGSVSAGISFCVLIPDSRAQINADFAALFKKDMYALSPAFGVTIFF
jgi:hypothetical protein